jgi:hypothetical protein
VVDKPVDYDVLRLCVERYAGWSHAGRCGALSTRVRVPPCSH